MEILSTITVTPDQLTGVFQPSSFQEWVGQHVQVAGLDPAYHHTLRAVEIVAGPRMVLNHGTGTFVEQVVPGGAAVLTVHTEAPFVPDHASYVQIINGLPQARVRIVRADTGEELVRGKYPAPLGEGQVLQVGGDEYQVSAVNWPNRHPEHGSAGDLEDYQLATVIAVPPVPELQLAPSDT